MEAYVGLTFVTGEICRPTGLYRARRHPALPLELDEDAVFPPSRDGGREHAAMWEYVCSP